MLEVRSDLQRSSGPTNLLKQSHVILLAQGCVIMLFEYSNAWNLLSFSVQPVSMLSQPHSEKKVFLDVQTEPPVFLFVPIASCPVIGHY